MAVLGFFASSFHYPNLYLLALLLGSSQESKIALTQKNYILSTVWGVSRDKYLQEKRELWHEQTLHSTVDNGAYFAFIVMASLTTSVQGGLIATTANQLIQQPRPLQKMPTASFGVH